MLLFIDLQAKLEMIFCHLNRTLNYPQKSCHKIFHTYLQLLVIIIQNLDIGIAKTLILLRGFQLKTQRLNLDYIKIKKRTLILKNSSSCIDLVLKSNPTLTVDSATHPSQHPNCHHQIIYAKLESIIPHLLLVMLGTKKIQMIPYQKSNYSVQLGKYFRKEKCG